MERKVATVLFADLVDSTGLGEGDPEQTRALLERFYAATAEEVEQAGGTVEKFAGDAVMAAFGAPVALEDHAERALHAALAMQRRLPDGLAMRVGVNTGEVVVDEPRSGTSWVSGDVVNVCARLEQNAETGEVLVGERTAQMAGAAFEFDELRRIEVKGKQEPVACRRLLRALSLMRPRGIAGLPSVFAGRDRELAVLRDAFEAAVAEGRPQLVTIVGDAGVGKSRLVRELWADLGERDVLDAWAAASRTEAGSRTGRSARSSRRSSACAAPRTRCSSSSASGASSASRSGSTSPATSTRSPRATACATRGSPSSRSSHPYGRSCS